jgi:tRNA U34 5-methylaminomethyl-2-thiouridine-forming methyltransferase MnmC
VRWFPLETQDGSWTLVHPVHGEACHSLAGAWTQARERYALPCGLAQRAREIAAEGGTVLRLLDIGTGLGLNLAAALEALESSGVALEAVTLELDSSVPRAAIELARGRAQGPWLDWHAPVLRALATALDAPGRVVPIARGTASVGNLRLVLGDARETLPALEPALEMEEFDAVFLDPFSPRVDPSLWEEPFLREVARRMAPLSRLSTYSSSFAVRLALARAGLCVGKGPRVGAKSSGTLACRGCEPPPLEPRAARRLARRAREGPAPESSGVCGLRS